MTINPYEATAVHEETNHEVAWQAGELVVVSPMGLLPPRCIVCNRPSSRESPLQLLHEGHSATPLVRIFIISVLGIVGLILLGSVVMFMRSSFATHYPYTCGITCCVVAGIVINLAGSGLLGVIHQYVTLRLGFCQRHALFWSLRSFMYVPIALTGLSYLSRDVPKHLLPTWLPTIRPQIEMTGYTLLVLSPIVMLIGLGSMNFVVVKIDDAKRLWIKGIPEPFRTRLPAWKGDGISP